jgi:hypothetical protein
VQGKERSNVCIHCIYVDTGRICAIKFPSGVLQYVTPIHNIKEGGCYDYAPPYPSSETNQGTTDGSICKYERIPCAGRSLVCAI